MGTSETVIPIEVLDDLCSRFIINVPEVERKDLVRICFQIEQAHWFYIDFYSKQDNYQKNRKLVNLKEFAGIVFKHVPFLQPFSERVDQVIDEWKEYKFCVPTYGAILLSEDFTSVLLVQSFSSKSSWGFPKGKINLSETPWQCAIREVKEETGFDIQEHMDPSVYLEAIINDQTVRLYIIPGISMDQQFIPKTRNEIKSVRWFPLADLPATKKEAVTKLKTSTGTVSLFMVTPFVRKLREWIADALSQVPRKSRRARNKSCSDLEGLELKDSIQDKKKGRKVHQVQQEVQQGPELPRPASAVMKQKKTSMEYATARQASEAETKVRRTLEYVMLQNPKIGSPVGPLDESQKKTPNQQIRILKKPETISGKDLLTSLFNKDFSDPKLGVGTLKKASDDTRKIGSTSQVAESPQSKSLGSIHHDRTLSSFARVSHKTSGRNYFLSHSPAVDRMKPDKFSSPDPVKPDVKFIPNDDKNIIRFAEIPFSKSFYKHGAKAWSNFKFDRQAIIRSMNG